MDSRLVLALWIIVALLMLRRFLQRYKEAQVQTTGKVEEVLSSDKYKVKGQFEDLD